MELTTFLTHLIKATEQTGLTIEQVIEKVQSWDIHWLDVEDYVLHDPDARPFEAGHTRFLAGFLRYRPQDTQALYRALDCGMKINSMVSLHDFLHNPSEEAAVQVVKDAAEVDAKTIMVVPGYAFDGDDMQKLMETSLKPMKLICDLAGEKGIRVGVESYDHFRNPTSTEEGMDFYLENIPELTCIFDTGNFYYRGLDIYRLFRKYRPRIDTMMHCKDRGDRPRDGLTEVPFARADNTLMWPAAAGEGVVPLKEILTDLASENFSGRLAIENYNSEDFLNDIERSARYIKSFFGEEIV